MEGQVDQGNTLGIFLLSVIGLKGFKQGIDIVWFMSLSMQSQGPVREKKEIIVVKERGGKNGYIRFWS